MLKRIFNRSNLVNVLLAGIAAAALIAMILLWQRNQQTPLQFYDPLILGFVTIGCLFFASLLWSAENKARLLLASTALLTALFISELSLSLIGLPSPLNGKVYRERVAKQQGVAIDTRNKYQVVTDLRTQQSDVWPNIGPQYFVSSNGLTQDDKAIFPLGGISNSFVVVCNETGQFSTYHSDEHGFNNPKGLYQQLPLDVLIVGDSFAHGACVNEGEDIASVLRTLGFRKTLTLGSNGIGPLIELANLSEYGPHLKPKKVFWLYYEGNDLHDLQVESKSAFLFRYFDQQYSQNLFQQQHVIDTALKNYVESQKQVLAAQYDDTVPKTTLMGVLKLRALRSQLMLNQERVDVLSSPIGLFENILATAQKRVAAWGGELIVVYLPEYARYKTKDVQSFNSAHHKDQILNIARNLGIAVIDMEQSFQKVADPLALFPLRIGGHYTAEGYQLVAQEISQTLATNKT